MGYYSAYIVFPCYFCLYSHSLSLSLVCLTCTNLCAHKGMRANWKRSTVLPCFSEDDGGLKNSRQLMKMGMDSELQESGAVEF